MNRLMKDLAVDRERNPGAALLDRWDPAQEEDEDDDEVNIIDRGEYFPTCWGDCPNSDTVDRRRRPMARSI